MIVVWILSYLAAYMLGIATIVAAVFITLHMQEKKIAKTEEEMRKYGEGEPRIRTPRSSFLN